VLRWTVAGLAALTLTVAGPPLAVAHGKPRHSCAVNLTATVNEIDVTSGNPPFSGSNVGSAIVDGKLCGKPFHGAMRDVNHFPSLGKVSGAAQVFGPSGSVKVRFAETAAINSDQSATLRGKWSISGGTGLWKGATGSGKATGQQPAGAPVTIQHLVGTLSY
jgi:hypothetical protein